MGCKIEIKGSKTVWGLGDCYRSYNKLIGSACCSAHLSCTSVCHLHRPYLIRDVIFIFLKCWFQFQAPLKHPVNCTYLKSLLLPFKRNLLTVALKGWNFTYTATPTSPWQPPHKGVIYLLLLYNASWWCRMHTLRTLWSDFSQHIGAEDEAPMCKKYGQLVVSEMT